MSWFYSLYGIIQDNFNKLLYNRTHNVNFRNIGVGEAGGGGGGNISYYPEMQMPKRTFIYCSRSVLCPERFIPYCTYRMLQDVRIRARDVGTAAQWANHVPMSMPSPMLDLFPMTLLFHMTDLHPMPEQLFKPELFPMPELHLLPVQCSTRYDWATPQA